MLFILMYGFQVNSSKYSISTCETILQRDENGPPYLTNYDGRLKRGYSLKTLNEKETCVNVGLDCKRILSE